MGLSMEEIKEREISLQKLKITTFRDNKGYVFVSYKSDDWRKVFEGKVFELQERKMRVYSDKNFDETNDSWLQSMESNIRRSSAFLMFISKHYLTSYATLIEMLTAINYGIPIVPVYIPYKDEKVDFSTYDEAASFLKDDPDLMEQKVRMNLGEETTLLTLMKRINGNTKVNKEYKESIESLAGMTEYRIRKQEFTVNNVVEIFDDIFSRGLLQANSFDGMVDNLVSTIKSAAAKAEKKDPFEEIADVPQPEPDNQKPAQSVQASQQSVKEDPPKVAEVISPELPKPEAPKQETFRPEPPKAETPEVSYQEEEPEEGLKSKSTAAQEGSVSSEKGRVYSATGDLTYELYGQKRTGNQSDMMIMCIGKVLKNNPGVIDEAIESLLCLSGVDYESVKKDNRPSYFRACHTFIIDGKTVCIGTAFGIKDKLRHIASVINMAEEDPTVVKIDGLELPDVGDGKSRGNENIVAYKLYREEYKENQSLMMIRSISAVLEQNPEVLDEAMESFGILSDTDYEKIKKDDRPSYFKVCRTVQIGGRTVCIGASCGKMSEKLRQIANIIAFAEEDPSILSIDGYELPEVRGLERRSGGKENMVSYRLYGRDYESNQSVMLFTVISEVLKHNTEIIDEAMDKMVILSSTDYEKMKVADRGNYFKNCRTYVIDGRTVCVGATCGKINEKLRYIANLMTLAKEEPSVLEIDGYELPDVGGNGKKGNSSMVSYKLYEEDYEDNQSDMMIKVITEVLRRNPAIVDQAEESISCLTNVDYENVNRDDRPSYFRNCETVRIGKKRICIGTALGMSEKLRMISNVIALAQEDPSVFAVDDYEIPQTSSGAARGRKKAAKNYDLDL